MSDSKSPYRQFVDGLDDEQVERLLQGQTGVGCNDRHYLLSEQGCRLDDGLSATTEGRERLRQWEPQLLAKLFRTRALCRDEFEYQAARLLAQHGAARFCHHPGNDEGWALMIEEAQLIAVGPDDVRSRYGYFCQCDEALEEAAAGARVTAWLQSGDAYDDYRAKTTCRYC